MTSRLTVTDLWSEGWALAQRQLPAAGPVAAAFVFLPQVLQAAAIGSPPEAEGIGSGLVQLAVFVVGLFGQVAIAAIFLGAAPDVAGALRRAGALVPRVLAILALFLLLLIPVALVFGFVAAVSGVSPEAMARPGGAGAGFSLLVLLFVAAALFLGARLFTLLPVLVVEGQRARATVGRSWRLTAGSAGTLLGFLVTFLLALIFLSGVVNIVAGATFGLLLGAGSPLGALLIATLIAAVGTALAVVSIAAAVVAYRRLAQ